MAIKVLVESGIWDRSRFKTAFMIMPITILTILKRRSTPRQKLNLY